MNKVSHILRGAVFFVALYAGFSIHPVMGLILFATGLFSFVFKLRKALFLEASKRADYWEVFGVALVLANSLIIGFGNYNDPYLSWLDIPMHLAGGAFAAWWAMLSIRQLADKEFGRLRSLILVLGIAAFVGVGWEFFEWIGDHTLVQWYALPIVQLTLADTMSDLLFDLLGGAAIFFFSKK